MEDDILTLKEVASYLKLIERILYRFALEGQVPGFKVGNSWRFKRADIERWIEDQKERVLKAEETHSGVARRKGP
jgi:excisionase family DNA binding protein